MIRALLNHYYDRARCDELELRGIENCHVRGLHSIMLRDVPGDRLRMYFATPSHELHHAPGGPKMALAAHTHHCDVTLINVHGGGGRTLSAFAMGPVHGPNVSTSARLNTPGRAG